jgi:hypothetical protein
MKVGELQLEKMERGWFVDIQRLRGTAEMEALEGA